MGRAPPRSRPGKGGSVRRTVNFHFSVDFESYWAVHTTFTIKTMVEVGLEHVFLAQRAVDAEICPILGPKFYIITFPAEKAQNGPILAVFWEFLRREGPKRPEKLGRA